MAKTTRQRRPPVAAPVSRDAMVPAQTTPHDVLVQIGVVFAVAILLRALHFWVMRNSVFFEVLVCDGRQYDVWGRRLAAGNWIGSEIFYQTPLYPYLLGTIYATVGHSIWAVRIVQALLGSLACVFVARAGSAWFSHRVGWISGILLAVYPPAIFFDGIIQKAALDLFFMSGILWATGAAQLRPRWLTFATIGLLLGGMTLNRENAVLLVPLLLAWAVWLTWDHPVVQRLGRAAAIVAAMGVVLVPVGLRNYYVGGQFLLTTSQMGPNFYIGNHAGASGLYEPLREGRGDPLFESQDARILAQEALGRQLTPGEVSDYWMSRSWQDISANPMSWVKLLAAKWFLTWNALEVIDAESIRVHQQQSWPLNTLGWIWHFGILCPLAAAGVWLTRNRWRSLWLLYAMLLTFAFAVTLFFVFARYRYPLVPVAMLFAGSGLVEAAALWRTRPAARGWDLAIAAGIALVAAIFCNWPLPGLINDEVSYITTATTLMDDQKTERAIELLHEATRINPRSVHALANLGVASQMLNRFDNAQRYFRQAIAVQPNFALAYHGLGEADRSLGQVDTAKQQWRKALELDPQLATTYRSLANAELTSGNLDETVALLRRSLQLEPQSVAARVDLTIAYIKQNKLDDAREILGQLVGEYPRVREANNLAWILATAPNASLRNPDEALRLAQYACEITAEKLPDLLDTLAAAQANAGDYDAAQRTNEDAVRLARKTGPPPLVDALVARGKMYAAKQPYRDPQLAPPSERK